MTGRIIIIGFGPAGMACAIQLKRMGISPLVIEKGEPAGMLSNAGLVENYLGFPQGIPGAQLAELFRKQASRFRIEVIHDEINRAGYSDDLFILDGHRERYRCSVLVIATGTQPRWPAGIPPEMLRAGLIHTDISILGKTEGKVIGIVGAGDAAFDYSLTLTGNGNEVLIFNRGKRIRALKTLRDKVLNHEKIRYFEDMSIESFILQPDHGFQAIGHHASSKQDFYLDYLIFATGRDPALHFLDQNILANKEQLQERHLLYEIGDVHNRDFRQLSLAVGDGIRAAMEIYRNESNQ